MLPIPPGSNQQVVYQNKYQQVYQVRAEIHGAAREYFVTDYGSRAGLIIVKGVDVLLVRQYRLFIDRLSWEVPGGKVDEGETPAAAAERECLEETGVRGRNLRPLLTYQPGLDTLHNPTHLFYTDEFAVEAADLAEHHEVQEHGWISLRECLAMVANGQVVDSFSIIALLSYQMFICGK